MAFNVNCVVLAGNLCREIDAKGLPDGGIVAKSCIAINGGSSKNPETVYVDFEAWGKSAEFCRDYLGKGSPVLLEGRLKLEQWQKNGEKRSRLLVVANRVQSMRNSDKSTPEPRKSAKEEYLEAIDRRTEGHVMPVDSAYAPPVVQENNTTDDIPF